MIYRRIIRLITVLLEARSEEEAEHLNKTRVKLSKGTMGVHRALDLIGYLFPRKIVSLFLIPRVTITPH